MLGDTPLLARREHGWKSHWFEKTRYGRGCLFEHALATRVKENDGTSAPSFETLFAVLRCNLTHVNQSTLLSGGQEKGGQARRRVGCCPLIHLGGVQRR
jgi:hypothetical protein